jgi:hypothetical protein
MFTRDNADLYRDKATIYKGEVAAAVDTTQSELSVVQKRRITGNDCF